MSEKKIGFTLQMILLAVTLTACALLQPQPTPRFYQAETTKPYADVLAELELAIAEQNFRITGHNKIGSVIRDREGQAYPDYDTLQFCNLTQAREMLDISPAAVAYMPCNIAIRSEQGKVIITAPLLPTDSPDVKLNTVAERINRQLKRIVDFAVEE